ncbi:MAG: hypothetical protein IH590_07960 [Aquamicrobium sp.]|nr:hypothetical protein [Aquamicrobium sp.]
MMNLPGLVALLVDGRDFRGEHEGDRPPAGGRQRLQKRRFDLRPEPEEAVAFGHQLVLDLGEPARMHAVAGADHGDPLARRPPEQVLEIEVPARGPGIFRVDVQIGKEGHETTPFILRTGRGSSAAPAPH